MIFQEKEHWELGSVGELIHRYRRLVLVHSIIYYKFDNNLISDYEFDRMSRELATLQKDHPDISESVLYHRDSYRGFEGSTGAFLPLDDRAASEIAVDLLRLAPFRHAGLEISGELGDILESL